MWVCLNYHEFNSPENENCSECHTARPPPRTPSSKGRRENKVASLFLEGIKRSVDNTPVVRTRRPASEGTLYQRKQYDDVEKVTEHLVQQFKDLHSNVPNEPKFTRHNSNMSQMTNHMLVAAVDFGTTYSGYAFSFHHEFKDDPLKIHANQAWNAGGRSLLSLKTPTCLLLNKNKEFVAFGYDAENMFSDFVMEGEQNKYYYFHRFKMKLHNNKHISNEMVLKDISDKPVLALDVFSLAIKALVNHLLDLRENRGTNVEMKDILWVLTVPAIWSDAAKRFMRNSAEKAGILENNLKIALEPEAASIHSQYLPTKKLIGAEKQGFKMTEPGTKYMVVDLGGHNLDMLQTTNHMLVAAVDFGTTYSGYAFSFRHEFKETPLKIHANQAWNAGGRSLLSLKTPTCLLLNKNKEFVAFGYDAENMFYDIVMEGEQNNYFYFHRFKMKLHNNKHITNEMVLNDISDKQVLALDVFSLAIKALVTHLLDILEKRGTDVEMKDILWVLTVPAIWSDAAKQFMRRSAEKAGIPESNLNISLEPEAASIYSQYLPTKKLLGAEQQGFTMTEPGTKYMVVDLGGGTADITVHKKLSNGGLEELKHATGNDCGGTSVDGNFFQILTQIVGGPLIKIFQEEDPEGYLDLFREFEVVKRTIHPGKTGKINLSIPYASLNEKCKTHLGEALPDVLSLSPFKDKISFRGDKMRIDTELMKNIFKPTIDSIISLIQSVFDRDALIEVSQILLVGGFSECLLIQDAIKMKFPNKRVIIPEEAGLSVLKGAVLFGHRPFYIESRKMKYTYGIEVQQQFDPSQHDSKHLVLIDGKEYCDKIFDKLVKINETVPVGSTINRSYSATGTTTETDELSFFISTDEDPQYTDEDSCFHLGKLTIPLSDPCEGGRPITAQFHFGGTEIALTVTEVNSGNQYEANFNLI